MSAKIFEYVVLYHPKPKRVDGEDVREKSVIVVDVKRVLAESEKDVNVIAGREIPVDYLDKLDRVEILVRPF